jgi:dinuclear metal center YbgI/SA1388 family protein
MRVKDVVAVMEAWAPTSAAEPWDNVGLLVGDPEAEAKRVLLAIDFTRAVAAEAFAASASLVIAYHPPIFEGLKRLGPSSDVFRAIEQRVAIYSPHTALDVAEGGTNDVLADAVGLEARGPLRPVASKDAQYKLVVFVPEDHLEKVSEALFEAGAGRIGRYASCSFRSGGTGTFFGEEGTTPAVGQAGRLERASEVRLETVVPIDRVGAVVRGLRAAHPYEEPAFDLVRLAPPPVSGRHARAGMGRIGDLPAPVPRAEIVERVKRELGLPGVLVAGAIEGDARRVAVCAGACGDLYKDALRERADVYVTGEMRHHDALAAAARGMLVVAALHSNSERKTLARVRERLTSKLGGRVEVTLSEADRDPFTFR